MGGGQRAVPAHERNVRARKQAERARMRAVLRGVTEPRRVAAGRALAAALDGHPRWPAWRCLLGFAATAREPATAPALVAAHAAGLVVGLPRVAGTMLRFHVVQPHPAQPHHRSPAHAPGQGIAGLHAGYRGIAEPAPDAPPLDFESLAPHTVVLVPGAAFDRTGARLGWGGGFYDRALAAITRSCGTALLVGVCFAEQLVECVPRASHDVPVDLVVSEGEVVQAARGRQPLA
jgi:5-formyltetrahydrofolate cyclo-ligase